MPDQVVEREGTDYIRPTPERWKKNRRGQGLICIGEKKGGGGGERLGGKGTF